MTQFEKGDRVRCISKDHQRLTYGKTYVVYDVKSLADRSYLFFSHSCEGFSPHRFELISQTTSIEDWI